MNDNQFKPSLTLAPTDPIEQTPQPTINLEKQEPEPPQQKEEQSLSPEELKTVEEFAKKINIKDSAVILQYGANTQKNVASFSEKTLKDIRTKDLGQVGDSLTALVKELKSLDQDESKEKGLKALFKKKKDSLETMRTNYATVEANINKITSSLEDHQVVLMKDIAMFDQMYQLNTQYYKELTMYILAGKKRLQELRATELAQLEQKALTSGNPQDAQEYNDYANLCTRFEKKIHDLDLTRMISIQMGPQTRLLQNNNIQMVEKIESSLVNTIPLWKSQMVLAIGLEHATHAAAAQKAVSDITNDMLKQNADLLKINTVNTAKEMERAIVDMDTLRHTNQQLISSLDEVLIIQREGAQKRREAEAELTKIEGELKTKLLEIRDASQSLPKN